MEKIAPLPIFTKSPVLVTVTDEAKDVLARQRGSSSRNVFPPLGAWMKLSHDSFGAAADVEFFKNLGQMMFRQRACILP